MQIYVSTALPMMACFLSQFTCPQQLRIWRRPQASIPTKYRFTAMSRRQHKKPKTENQEEKIQDTNTPTPEPPRPWSEWIWSDSPPGYFRARKASTGEWEYDYHIPEPATEDSTTSIPRTTPTLLYSSLVIGNDFLKSLYAGKEEFEEGAYTWSPEPVYLDLSIISPAGEEANAIVEAEDSKVANEDAKVVVVEQKSSETSLKEQQQAIPKTKKKAKERKDERKNYLVAEWRDDVNEVLLKGHKTQKHSDRKEAKRGQRL